MDRCEPGDDESDLRHVPCPSDERGIDRPARVPGRHERHGARRALEPADRLHRERPLLIRLQARLIFQLARLSPRLFITPPTYRTQIPNAM